MELLDSVKKAISRGGFINVNCEAIIIPKFNVYIPLKNVNTDEDFYVALCEYFSRDCCCALRYSQNKRLKMYWEDNTLRFNYICGTNFSVSDMQLIYNNLGNGVRHNLAAVFVRSGFDLRIFEGA